MEDFLASQLEYYRQRAAEYDQWFLRQGRYDRGDEWNRRWFSEVDEARTHLVELGSVDHCLELACGTGLWTERLARQCKKLTAIDGASEMLKICRARLGETGLDLSQIQFVEDDLFEWEPSHEAHDLVFMSFWLSHVPPVRLDEFLQKVYATLKPGGRVFILDSRRSPQSTADDHVLPSEYESSAVRKLNDGREYTILKLFYDPNTLRELLNEAGFASQVRVTNNFFITAVGKKP
jgi:ubiquinone/menaquinone biosynthesis C-methylase UbiE